MTGKSAQGVQGGWKSPPSRGQVTKDWETDDLWTRSWMLSRLWIRRVWKDILGQRHRASKGARVGKHAGSGGLSDNSGPMACRMHKGRPEKKPREEDGSACARRPEDQAKERTLRGAPSPTIPQIVLATSTHLLGIWRFLGGQYLCWCIWALSVFYFIYTSPLSIGTCYRKLKCLPWLRLGGTSCWPQNHCSQRLRRPPHFGVFHELIKMCRSCHIPSGPWTQRGHAIPDFRCLGKFISFGHQTFIEQLLCALMCCGQSA